MQECSRRYASDEFHGRLLHKIYATLGKNATEKGLLGGNIMGQVAEVVAW